MDGRKENSNAAGMLQDVKRGEELLPARSNA